MTTRTQKVVLGDLTWEVQVPANATEEEAAKAAVAAYKAGVLNKDNAIKAQVPAPIPAPPPKAVVASKETKKDPSIGDVMANKLRYMNATGGVADLGNSLLGGFEWIVDKALKATGKEDGLPTDSRIGGGLDARSASLKQFAQEKMGYDPDLKATDTIGRLAEAAVEGAYPTNLMNPIKGATGIVSAAGKALGQTAVNVGGSVGAQAAIDTVAPTSTAGALATGLVGGTAGGALAGGAPTVRVAGRVASMFSKYLDKNAAAKAGQAADKLAGNMATGRVDRVLAQAIKQDPSLVDNLRKQESMLGDTGINVPTINVANPVLDQQMNRMVSSGQSTSTGDSVRAINARTSAEAGQATEQFQKDRFGDPTQARDSIDAEFTFKDAQLAKGEQVAGEQRSQFLEELDDRISDMSKRADSGAALENLYSLKEQAARKTLGEAYESIADALNQGAYKQTAQRVGTQVGPYDPNRNFWTLDPQTRDQVSDNARRLNAEEFITMMSPTEQRVMSFLSDKSQPLPGFRDLDTIKRAVNRLIYRLQPGTPERLRAENFREYVVDPMRNNLPPDAKQAYELADLNYAKAMGIDQFGAQALKDIDSSKYYAQVSRQLTTNPEAIKQYVKVTGPEGQAAVGDALMAKLRADSIATGKTPDATWYQTWIRRNKDVIDEVPGLEDKLLNPVARAKALDDNAEAARLARKDYLEKDLVGRYKGDGEAMIRDFLRERSSLASKTIEELSAQGPKVAQFETVQAMRSLASDYMLRHPVMFKEMTDNRTMRDNMARLMGPSYIKDMEKLQYAAQNGTDRFGYLRNNSNSVSDAFKDQFGITAPSLISRLMDRVAGPLMIGSNIARTVVINKADQQFNSRLADLLSGTQGRQQLLTRLDELGLMKDKSTGKPLTPKQIEEVAGKMLTDSKLGPFMSELIKEIKEGAVDGAKRGAFQGANDSGDSPERVRTPSNQVITPTAPPEEN